MKQPLQLMSLCSPHTAPSRQRGLLLLLALHVIDRMSCDLQHMALTIDEELSLHNRLLTELDEDVNVTHSRMRAAQKRVRQILRDSGGCKFSCAAFGLALMLVLLIALLFKLL